MKTPRFVKNTGFDVNRYRFESWLCHLLIPGSGANYLTLQVSVLSGDGFLPPSVVVRANNMKRTGHWSQVQSHYSDYDGAGSRLYMRAVVSPAWFSSVESSHLAQSLV